MSYFDFTFIHHIAPTLLSYGHIMPVISCSFCICRKQMRLLRMPVPRCMIAAVFLTNCVNCHYPNRTEKYFDCAPPSLSEYFAIMRQPPQANINNYAYY